MTSNDKQIDLLMRRFTQSAPRASVTGHLDADELSAFAEGALPPATRAQFVTHLADCDDCRKQASALAISSGAVVRAEQKLSEAADGRTFWQALAGIFALPVLRYAAFAAVLLIVAGIAFVALRRPRQSASLVARNESSEQQSATAAKPVSPGLVYDSPTGGNNRQATDETRPAESPATRGGESLKRDGKEVAEDTAAKPQSLPAKEATGAAPAPLLAEKKAGQGEVAQTQTQPSYAPVPPAEAGYTQSKQGALRDQQAGISGPRQQQQKLESLDKTAVQERERDANKDVFHADEAARKSAPRSVASNQPGDAGRTSDLKAKGPMRNSENSALRNENRAEPPKTTLSGADSADKRGKTEEAPPETRSAGGRKFRRQGNAWVDQKFKASMSLKSVSRGSDEFAALDSGLRSIAQQLGGEVIVVWKGKAYLIK